MILDFIGALIRYTWISLVAKIKGNELKSFSEFTNDKNLNVGEKLDKGASDTIIGGIFLVIILILIYSIS